MGHTQLTRLEKVLGWGLLILLKKWIGYYEGCMSNESCDDVVSHMNNARRSDLEKSTYSNNKGTSDTSNERVRMDEVWFRNCEKYYDTIREAFLEAIRRYSKKHKDFSCILHTDFRLNKYSEGGFMSRHLDNIHHSHGQQYGYPQVSALLFLNDDYEGGEFIVAKEVYKPNKGSAIIFPSNFMFPHEVTTIRKGVRWSVVTWMM